MIHPRRGLAGGYLPEGRREGGMDGGEASPPLWRRSPPASPASRLQEIARGQRELMEMVEKMPETAFELSLRDMVELPKAAAARRSPSPPPLGPPVAAPVRQRRRIQRTESDKTRESRSGYVGNGDFLLKLFLPATLKRSGSGKGRVSPVKSPEGEWWKRKPAGLGEADRSGRSSTSSSSSNSSGRQKGGLLPGCWSFFNISRSKGRKQIRGGLSKLGT